MKAAIFVPLGMALPQPGPIIEALVGVALRSQARGGYWLPCGRAGALDHARTVAAERAIEDGATHILYLDADHLHPPDILERLAAHRLPVVGGLNFSRAGRACALPRDGGPLERDTGLRRCRAVGTGCLLVETGVFKRLEYPWFYFDYGRTVPGGGMWEGEDTGFCRRCEAAGVPVMCDTAVTSPHYGVRWLR